MKDKYAIINGKFVIENEASILISDLAIQRGYGVFDYFRTYNGQPIFLDHHLERLHNSATKLNLTKGIEPARLKALLAELIDRNGLPDTGIRITVTGGYSEDGYLLSIPNVLITQTPYQFDKNDFCKGTRLVTSEYQRQMPEVKTIDYLQAIFLQSFIKENNADDVLYYDQDEVRECPRANFFMVNKNGEVLTPSLKVLKGITRKMLLTFPDYDIKESVVDIHSIETAKEAFITSSTKNVLPVLSIDGKQVGNGKPGEITRKIYNQLMALKGMNG